jgi:aminoglycoside phosphotransferase (APT) family kinase protein
MLTKLIAWKDALEKAGVMHGDISSGNILIYEKEPNCFQGLLVDWDLSKLLSAKHGGVWHQMVRKPDAL